jgi:hypothetical protein
MNLSCQDALKIIGAGLLSVGGGGVIVVALSSWLGKVWANRLMQKDIARHAAELEALKSELDGMNKKVQAELDKSVYVHRVHFETEFRALSEIWAKVVAVRAALAQLRPHLELIPPEEDNDLVRADKVERKLTKFVTASGELRMAVHNQSPFYQRNIYDELVRLIDALVAEETQVKLDHKPFTSAWFKQGEENWAIVVNTADRISEMIRGRIQSLSLYRD